jgi:hypothetical protein
VGRPAGDAQRQGLDEELRKLLWTPLLIVDEVGYIPFDPQAANLMFSLVSSRHERASLIVTSNKPFSAWGETFGDEVAAAAMIDRLVHHAEILSLKGTATASATATSAAARPPKSPKPPDQPVAPTAPKAAEGRSARRSQPRPAEIGLERRDRPPRALPERHPRTVTEPSHARAGHRP